MRDTGNGKDVLRTPKVLSAMGAPVRAQMIDGASLYRQVMDSAGQALSGSKQRALVPPTDLSDPTGALFEAWARVCDVLGFYQERIVNEGYIGTAVEERSVFELARMVGYAPDTGLAANCYLYYRIDASVEGSVLIPRTSKVRAIPQPGEEPQSFETSNDLHARSLWNEIRIASSADFPFQSRPPVLYFAGTTSGLKEGDLVWVKHEDKHVYLLVKNVEIDRETDQTALTIVLRYGSLDALARPEDVTKPGEEKSDRPAGAPQADGLYRMSLGGHPWVERNIITKLARPPKPDSFSGPIEMAGFRKRARVFGHNAQQRLRNPRDPGQGSMPWHVDIDEKGRTDIVDLDGHHPEIVPTSELCIEVLGRSVHGEDLERYEVKAVELLSRTGYGMTGNITRIKLDRHWKSADWEGSVEWDRDYDELVQRAIVHLDPVRLVPGTIPIETVGKKPDDGEEPPRPPKEIELDGFYPGIEPGRLMILDGEPPEKKSRANDQEPELVTVASVWHPAIPVEDGLASEPPAAARRIRTVLRLEDELRYTYDPKTVRLYGNVVAATHGETYAEVLGSGAGPRENQSFALARSPLTHLPAPTLPGARPELRITVGDEEWQHVDTLARPDNEGRVFSLWIDDTSTARVYFGDGQAGARLPTGRENVRASYRIGRGRTGNLSRDRLKLAVDHPLGVQDVTNTRASGGTDPEPLARVRMKVPASTVALDRLVSKEDFLQTARTYPGIAKARVQRRLIGARPTVVVSVLSDGVMAPEKGSDRLKALQATLMARQDGIASVVVLPGVLCPIRISATIGIERGGSWEATASSVRSALADVFGFERRDLGQALRASEVLAAIHSVKAVKSARITAFQRYADAPATGGSPESIEASRSEIGAELLFIQPDLPDCIKLEPAQS